MTTETPSHSIADPDIRRIRHELRRRVLDVLSVEDVTPAMRRIVLRGDDLADFESAGFDDHVKLFLPGADGQEAMRDYTPRRFDRDGRRLTLDFVLHDAGPATAFARAARPGDILSIGGPRGSAVIGSSVRRFLLVGDETALPAIGRFIEEARPDTVIEAHVLVTGAAEEQRFGTAAQLQLVYHHAAADQAARAALLLRAIGPDHGPEPRFAWIAAEASVARAVRTHLVETCGHPLAWLKSSGYWVEGLANASEKG